MPVFRARKSKSARTDNPCLISLISEEGRCSVSAWTTFSKVIERTLKKYLPDDYDPVDIYFRPYSSMGGEPGWIFVIETATGNKSASMNLGMHPTKLLVRRGILGVVDRLEKEVETGTSPKIQKPTPGQVRKVLASHD